MTRSSGDFSAHSDAAATCSACGDTKIDCPTCGYGMPASEHQRRIESEIALDERTFGSGGPSQLRQRAGGGETNEWYTPPEIFHALDCEFDMDVAAPYGGLSWIPAKRFLSYRDDGLSVPWEGRVWLNPPYGPHTAPWLGKLAQHGNGIALVFARTDVAWFHTIAPQASLISFVKGRISFVRGFGIERNGHNSAAPSCLMAFGDECADIVRRSNLGLCAVLA